MSPDVGNIIFILQVRKLRLSDLTHRRSQRTGGEGAVQGRVLSPQCSPVTPGTPHRDLTPLVLWVARFLDLPWAFYTSRLFPLPGTSFPSSLPGKLPFSCQHSAQENPSSVESSLTAGDRIVTLAVPPQHLDILPGQLWF